MSNIICSSAEPEDGPELDPVFSDASVSENINDDQKPEAAFMSPTASGFGDGAPVDSPSNRYHLPSATYKLTWSAQRIFQALALRLSMFVHAGVIVEILFTGKTRAELREVTASMARSRFEEIGELWKDGTDNRGRCISRPCRCSEDAAKALLNTRQAFELLPPITTVSASPILTVDEEDAPRILGFGYNRSLGGVFVTQGQPSPSLSLEEAVDAVIGLLRDFQFHTPADRARAVAALLTPAMVYGQLLGESRIPMFLIEADQSQSGKGYFTELVAAILGERPKIVVPRRGGVGSFDEDFNAALLRGCPIILCDNLRGPLDSPHIESFLTAGGLFMVRTFRRAPADIDPRRYIIFATSNRFESTADMENRIVRVRLCKRPQQYVFDRYPQGHILEYVRAHQPFYLAAVFAILREWIIQGRPQTEETRHSFRGWAQSMDWIILNLFKDRINGRLMDYDALPLSAETDLAASLGFNGDDVPSDPLQN